MYYKNHTPKDVLAQVVIHLVDQAVALHAVQR